MSVSVTRQWDEYFGRLWQSGNPPLSYSEGYHFLSTITTIISTSTAASQVLFFVSHYPHHSSTTIIVRHYQVVGNILSKSLFTSNIRIYLDDCPYITLQITSSAVRHSLRHHPNRILLLHVLCTMFHAHSSLFSNIFVHPSTPHLLVFFSHLA